MATKVIQLNIFIKPLHTYIYFMKKLNVIVQKNNKQLLDTDNPMVVAREERGVGRVKWVKRDKYVVMEGS